MLKTKFAFYALASTFFVFSANAFAMIQAFPSQVLCVAQYVVVAKVVSAGDYETSVAGNDPTGRYPHGDTTIEVEKVLVDAEHPYPIASPGTKLHVDVSHIEVEYDERAMPMGEYRRREALQVQNAAGAAPHGLIGRRYVFLVFVSPDEIPPRVGPNEPVWPEKHIFRAEVWADGEDDERMMYALTGANAETGLLSLRDPQSCEAHYNDPCTTDRSAKSVDQLKEIMDSAKASKFARQCAKNLLATRGATALTGLIDSLEFGNADAQSLAASAIRNIGPASDTDLPALKRIAEANIPRLIELYRTSEANAELHDQLGSALSGLAKFSPDMIVPVFVEDLTMPSQQRAAEWKLRYIGRQAKAAFPALESLLNNDLAQHNYANVDQLILTIAGVTDVDESVTVLSRLLSNPRTAEQAATALAGMGTDADRAIPALLRGLHDDAIPHKSKIVFAATLVKIGVDSSLVDDFLMEELLGEHRLLAAKTLESVDPLPQIYSMRLMDIVRQHKSDYPLNEYLCVSLSHTHHSTLRCPSISRDVVQFAPQLNPANCKPPIVAQPSARIDNYCRCRPDYTQLSFEDEEQGTLSIHFDVASSGRLIDARISKSSGFKVLDVETLNAARQCHFKPKIVRGKRENASFEQVFTWLLNERGDGITLNGQ